MVGYLVDMGSPISQIKEFGKVDAESEKQLGEFFLKTDAYQRIEDQRHIIVTGRKGTGKTAIYRSLLGRPKNYRNVLVSGLQFRNYPWNLHGEVQDTNAAPVERYQQSWRFLILVELAKLILTDPRHKLPNKDYSEQAAGVLGKFIEANWGNLDFKFRDVFRKKKFSFNFEPKVFGVSLGSLVLQEVPRGRLAGVLEEANNWMLQCLSYIINDKYWYFILFDDLDVAYDPDDSEYSARLIGLLQAARDIYNWAAEIQRDGRSGVGAHIAPVVMIRSDIYDVLQFPDKNKVTRNLVEPLSWTDQDGGENSLKALIDQRIKVITGDERTSWDSVFDPQLMRGTQAKYKHMAARTYLRPRDMIYFCNACLDEAKRAGNEMITNQNVSSSRPSYSEYLVDELDDEIHPVMNEWKMYLDLLRRVHKLRFSKEDFASVYRDLGLEDKVGMRVEESLEFLYRFSIVGFSKIGGAGYGGSAVAFRYKNPSIGFDPVASRLSVHPGLKEVLELVEASD